MRYYNKTNACDRCGTSFQKVWHPLREHNKEGNWTGKWLCIKCYEKYDPNSRNNILKQIANRRTGNQNPNCSSAKGDIFEELTCRWREVKNLNIIKDNFETPIDHSSDRELGVIQTKGKIFDPINKCWWSTLTNEYKKDFDNLIYYCISKDGNDIKKIYIFPKKEIVKRAGITIREKVLCGHHWYEQYISDERIIKNVDKLFKEIKEERNGNRTNSKSTNSL